MKTITSNYNLSKNDPHYRKKKQNNVISPKKWITKTYIKNQETRYLINFRCADRLMKIVQLDYESGSSIPKRKIFVLSSNDELYEEFYSYYKIARRINEDEEQFNVLLNRKK